MSNSQKVLNFIPADVFSNMPFQPPEWVWENQMAIGCVTLLIGKPKAGKSLFVKNLIPSIMHGTSLLGFECSAGLVLYLALEEHNSFLQKELRQLGIDTQSLQIHTGPTSGTIDETLIELQDVCDQFHPKLIVIDPMVKFVGYVDGNDYVEVYRELSQLNEFARKNNVHILLVHHANKGGKTDTDQVLGSQGLFGASDGSFFLSRDENNQGFIWSSARYGDSLEKTGFRYNENGHIEDFSAASGKKIENKSAEILGYIQSHGPQTIESLLPVGKIRKKDLLTTLEQLVLDGKLESKGAGKRGSPITFSVPPLESLGRELNSGLL